MSSIVLPVRCEQLAARRRPGRCPSRRARSRRPRSRGRCPAAAGRACAATASLITTHADAPSENWLALPAAIDAARQRGLDLRDAVVGRVGANAFVGGDRHFLREDARPTPCRRRPSSPSSARSRRRSGPPPRRRRRAAGSARRTRPAARARCRSACATFSAVSQHRPVDLGLVLGEPRVAQHVLVRLVLHARDRLDAAGDERRRLRRR